MNIGRRVQAKMLVHFYQGTFISILQILSPYEHHLRLYTSTKVHSSSFCKYFLLMNTIFVCTLLPRYIHLHSANTSPYEHHLRLYTSTKVHLSLFCKYVLLMNTIFICTLYHDTFISILQICSSYEHHLCLNTSTKVHLSPFCKYFLLMNTTIACIPLARYFYLHSANLHKIIWNVTVSEIFKSLNRNKSYDKKKTCLSLTCPICSHDKACTAGKAVLTHPSPLWFHNVFSVGWRCLITFC